MIKDRWRISLRIPSLDVLIPHFQDPAGLRLSLDSVRSQSWKGRLRVIVADDGSDAGSFEQVQEICRAFEAGGDHRTLVLRRDANKGRPYTRNELLDASEAPHIAWLDAGDTWMPSKLQGQFDYLSQLYHGGRNLSDTWITCNYLWEEGGHEGRKVVQDVSGDQFRALMTGGRLRAYLWTLLGSRESFMRVGYFDDRLPRLQDLDYFVRFVRGGGKILKPRSDEALATYYKSDVGRNASDVYEAYNLIIDKNRPKLIQYAPSLTRDLRHKAAKLAARFALNNGDRSLRIRFELAAMKLKPVPAGRQLARKIVNRLTT